MKCPHCNKQVHLKYGTLATGRKPSNALKRLDTGAGKHLKSLLLYVQETIGMPKTQLAKALNISIARVYQLERDLTKLEDE